MAGVYVCTDPTSRCANGDLIHAVSRDRRAVPVLSINVSCKERVELLSWSPGSAGGSPLVATRAWKLPHMKAAHGGCICRRYLKLDLTPTQKYVKPVKRVAQ